MSELFINIFYQACRTPLQVYEVCADFGHDVPHSELTPIPARPATQPALRIPYQPSG